MLGRRSTTSTPYSSNRNHSLSPSRHDRATYPTLERLGTSLSARKPSPRKEQNCAEKGNQHPARVCFGNGPNGALTILVATLIVLLSIRQDRESQSNGY
jgi:hypothetical protein